MGPHGGRLVAHHRRAYPAAASNFGGEKRPQVYPHRPGRRLPSGGTGVSGLEISDSPYSLYCREEKFSETKKVRGHREVGKGPTKLLPAIPCSLLTGWWSLVRVRATG